jgi:hypothetical protein
LFSPLISVKITRQIRSFLSILADYQMKITRQIRSFLTILAGYHAITAGMAIGKRLRRVSPKALK